MFSYLQAGILGALQGVTELFPISSLGHLVIVPALLGWNLNQSSSTYVGFVVLTHLATALVLLGFFWKEWVEIIRGMLRSLYIREVSEPYAKLGWLIVVSSIPVGILGLLFQNPLTSLFADPRLVAGVLVLNGIVLYVAEKLRTKAPKHTGEEAISRLSWAQAVGVGCAQAFALIPGFSRTGLSMTGGLVNGLSHENAARYAFLLATPVIFAAALLKVPDVFLGGSEIGQSLFGALCAAVAAYLSVRFLSKYFRTRTLTPFAIYCVLAGLSVLLILH